MFEIPAPADVSCLLSEGFVLLLFQNCLGDQRCGLVLGSQAPPFQCSSLLGLRHPLRKPAEAPACCCSLSLPIFPSSSVTLSNTEINLSNIYLLV